ncbi:MAG: acyltransferase family protein [Planctomycetota bacterium]
MRDVTLDNFKFVLITLVVVGHAIEPAIGSFDWARTVYIFIYLFHMPMFAYVSGVFSSAKIDGAAIRKIIVRLVIPYVFLETAYSLFDYFAFSREALRISPLVPYWIMWYMFSLVLWRLLLPIVSHFRFPVALSVVAGLACGINHYDYNLSFSRTFVFFPFFLIGHYYHAWIAESLKRLGASRLVGGVVIAVALLVLLVLPNAHEFDVRWLYGSKSYASLGVGWEQGVVYRSLFYAMSILLGVAFLSMIKADRGFGTAFGESSLYIYVLHGFVIKGLLAIGFYSYIDSEWKMAAWVFASLSLLPALSSRLAKRVAENIMNPLGLSDLLLARVDARAGVRSSPR